MAKKKKYKRTNNDLQNILMRSYTTDNVMTCFTSNTFKIVSDLDINL